MTTFAAVLASGPDAAAFLPDRSVAALRLAGTQPPARHHAGAFDCVAAATRATTTGIAVTATIVAVGDVRLDARAELRVALRRGRSDAAAAGERREDDLSLVVAAYEAWGDGAVERLRGDFSFALWDVRRRALLGARDGLGVRPLYYAVVPGGVVLSNVLNAVRAYPRVGAELDEPAVLSFLHLGWNADTATTTFAAIKRLAPGWALTCAGSLPARVFRHWRMPDPEPTRLPSDAAYIEHYRDLVSRAVVDRLEPPATTLFLSGGIDSPTLAATACRVAPADVRLSALTVRISDVETGVEARLAAAIARRLDLQHTLVSSPTDPDLTAPRRTPEPYDDPEFLASARLLQSLGAQAGVVIDGEDGDALFAPPGLRSMLRRDSVLTVAARIASYTLRHGHHPYLGFWLRRRLRFWKRNATPRAPSWLTPLGRSITPAREPDRPAHRARPEGASSLTASIWQSVHDGCDRAWHGAPVEYRWPFLDTRLLEFVFSIPPVPWCQRKHLARRAFAGELPDEVIARPKTTIPGYHDTLVARWRERTGAAIGRLHERTAAYVDAAELARVLRAGDTESVLVAWRALQLDAWIRQVDAA